MPMIVRCTVVSLAIMSGVGRVSVSMASVTATTSAMMPATMMAAVTTPMATPMAASMTTAMTSATFRDGRSGGE